MRVIAGEYGSRVLKAVPGKNTRPTMDKVKESIFNLLGGFFHGGFCLDFYGGSGALAIEAVSRGMSKAIICEKNPLAIQTIQVNIGITKEADKFIVMSGDNRKGLQRYQDNSDTIKFNLVFLDPPYDSERIADDINWLDERAFLSDSAQIICETEINHQLADEIGSFIKVKLKCYGLTQIHLYQRKR